MAVQAACRLIGIMRKNKIGSVLFLHALLLLLPACSNKQDTEAVHPPVAIASGDECHLCGMLIQNFPGPKGEMYLRGQQQALKFCSTRELFTYLLQPDTKAIVKEVYVHDMGKTDWQHPDYSAQAFVDARKAYYVINHPLKGSMGHTLASFAEREAANKFIKQHGGKLIRFDDITLDMLNQL